MATAIDLSEHALALLRIEGSNRVTDENRDAYRELEDAGLMEPLHTLAWGRHSAYRITEGGANHLKASAPPLPSPGEADGSRG